MHFMFDDCRHKDPMNEMMRYALFVSIYLLFYFNTVNVRSAHGQYSILLIQMDFLQAESCASVSGCLL